MRTGGEAGTRGLRHFCWLPTQDHLQKLNLADLLPQLDAASSCRALRWPIKYIIYVVKAQREQQLRDVGLIDQAKTNAGRYGEHLISGFPPPNT